MATSGSHETQSEVGIEPVPATSRQVLGFYDTFVLWADLGISFLVMVVGMFLVPGLGLGQALLAILVGAVIGNLLLDIAGLAPDLGASLPSFIIAFTLYAVLGRLTQGSPASVTARS